MKTQPAGEAKLEVGQVLRAGRSAFRRQERLRSLFRDHGCLTRLEIAKILEVAGGTATRDLQLLIAEGFVHKVRPSASPRSLYRGNQFPANYRTDAFVAQHGSWNRTVPDGYRVMRIRMDENGRVIGKSVFADGWLQRGSAWGRPVDVAEWTDGSLLVSDDRAGAIYRISYRK